MPFWGKNDFNYRSIISSILVLFLQKNNYAAVTFLKHWKQKNSEIAHRWDLLEFEEEEVIIFVISTTRGRKNNRYESHFNRVDLDLNLLFVRLQWRKIR